MDNRIPVIIYHEGSQEYLRTCVEHNKKLNRIVLIGDDSNKSIAGNEVEWHHFNEFENESRWSEFLKVFSNMSYYPDLYSQQIFKRLFILETYLAKNNIDRFVLFDSDILGYFDFNKLTDLWEFDAGFCVRRQKYDDLLWYANIGISFWRKPVLEDLVTFCINEYKLKMDELKLKWVYHLNKSEPGGICEMSIAYLWSIKTNYKTLNMADSSFCKLPIFDMNIASKENYDTNEYKLNRFYNIKKIIFKNELPYFIKETNDEAVQVCALHFVGASKKYMKTIAENKKIASGLFFNTLFVHKPKEIIKKFLLLPKLSS